MKKLVVIGVVSGVVLVAGCATNGGPDANDSTPLADSQAGFDYKQTDWSKPFWERWIDQARDDSRASSAAHPATSTGAGAVAQVGSGMQPKVGVYIDSDDHNSLAAYQLVNALDRHAAEHGVAIVKPDMLADAVSETSACSSADPSACPQVLAIYPGVRALLVIHPQAAGNGGTTNVETRMLDTDFGIQYESTNTRLELARADSRDEGSNLDIWSNRILGMAQDRIAIAPWFTHSFALDGQDMYISAGRHSGLDNNSVLVVHDGGSVVRAPGGRIVAWKPGPAVGQLRVKQFIGQNMAIAERVSGRMPTPQDKLTVSN